MQKSRDFEKQGCQVGEIKKTDKTSKWDLLLHFSYVFAMASSSRYFHTSGPIEFARPVFQFLQPISRFGLYLGNENRPNGTFRLRMPHIIWVFSLNLLKQGPGYTPGKNTISHKNYLFSITGPPHNYLRKIFNSPITTN